MAGHRPRPPLRRPAREGHPVRLPSLRRARRGDDRQRHHLPRPLGDARGGEGLRLLGRADRPPRRPARQLHLRPGARRPQVLRRRARRRRARPAGGAGAPLRRPLDAHPQPAAPPGAALRGDGDRRRAARRGGAARARLDARARRRAVGQGRLRRPGDRQGGPPRARHARRLRGDGAGGAPARGHAPRPGPAPGRRPGGLRHAPPRRHGGGLPGREPRPDGVAAAQQPQALLRHRDPGRDHPPRPDRRQDGPPLLRAAAGARGGHLPAPEPEADPGAHPRRAALPGAAPAHRHGGRRLHRRRGRGAAAGDGVQALGRADAVDRATAARRHDGARHRRQDAGGDRPRHHRLRPLRLPRVARGELRAHRLRQRLLEGPPPDRLLPRAAERLADGLLPPGDPGQGRRAARRRGAPGRRPALGVEVRLGGAGGRRGRAGRRAARGLPLRARPARARRACGSARSGRAAAPSATPRTWPAAAACARTSSKPWPPSARSAPSASPAAPPSGRWRGSPARPGRSSTP